MKVVQKKEDVLNVGSCTMTEEIWFNSENKTSAINKVVAKTTTYNIKTVAMFPPSLRTQLLAYQKQRTTISKVKWKLCTNSGHWWVQPKTRDRNHLNKWERLLKKYFRKKNRSTTNDDTNTISLLCQERKLLNILFNQLPQSKDKIWNKVKHNKS